MITLFMDAPTVRHSDGNAVQRCHRDGVQDHDGQVSILRSYHRLLLCAVTSNTWCRVAVISNTCYHVAGSVGGRSRRCAPAPASPGVSRPPRGPGKPPRKTCKQCLTMSTMYNTRRMAKILQKRPSVKIFLDKYSNLKWRQLNVCLWIVPKFIKGCS